MNVMHADTIWKPCKNFQIRRLPSVRRAIVAKVRRVISQSTFHLKGTGWYVTDYASKSGNTRSRGTEKGSDGVKQSETPSSTEIKTKKEAPAPSKAKE